MDSVIGYPPLEKKGARVVCGKLFEKFFAMYKPFSKAFQRTKE